MQHAVGDDIVQLTMYGLVGQLGADLAVDLLPAVLSSGQDEQHVGVRQTMLLELRRPHVRHDSARKSAC